MISTHDLHIGFLYYPYQKKQTLTESERNEDHEMEKISNIGLHRSYDGIIRNSMRQ